MIKFGGVVFSVAYYLSCRYMEKNEVRRYCNDLYLPLNKTFLLKSYFVV